MNIKEQQKLIIAWKVSYWYGCRRKRRLLQVYRSNTFIDLLIRVLL